MTFVGFPLVGRGLELSWKSVSPACEKLLSLAERKPSVVAHTYNPKGVG